MEAFREHAMALVEHYGALAVFVSLTLETLGAPLPGETALIAAATAAGAGEMKLWQVVLAAVAGAFLGGNIGYLIGRRYGRTTLVRYGARFGIDDARYARVEKLFQNYGALVVIVARFFVLLRQLNGVVAGATGMHPAKYLVANAVGSTLWVGFWVLLADRFGREIARMPDIWHHLGLVAALVTPALLVALILLAWRARRRDRT